MFPARRVSTHRQAIFAALVFALSCAAALTAGTAGAHFPGVEAGAACNDRGRVDVTVLVVSWVTDDDERRVNDRVEVRWDGVKIGEGAFTAANEFAFTIKLDLEPDGKKHTASAVALVGFGPGQEYGFEGTSRSAEVTLPASCAAPATTRLPTTTASTTTAAPPPTTTASTTTAAPPPQVSSTVAPTTTAGAQALGNALAALPEACVAQPQAVQPAFIG